MLFVLCTVSDICVQCVCVYESSKASAYSFGLATNPTRARGYPLNINPKPESISGPAGSGRVAELYKGLDKKLCSMLCQKGPDLSDVM